GNPVRTLCDCAPAACGPRRPCACGAQGPSRCMAGTRCEENRKPSDGPYQGYAQGPQEAARQRLIPPQTQESFAMFGPKKSVDVLSNHGEGQRLAKTLSWPHLIALGVGA